MGPFSFGKHVLKFRKADTTWVWHLLPVLYVWAWVGSLGHLPPRYVKNHLKDGEMRCRRLEGAELPPTSPNCSHHFVGRRQAVLSRKSGARTSGEMPQLLWPQGLWTCASSWQALFPSRNSLPWVSESWSSLGWSGLPASYIGPLGISRVTEAEGGSSQSWRLTFTQRL